MGKGNRIQTGLSHKQNWEEKAMDENIKRWTENLRHNMAEEFNVDSKAECDRTNRSHIVQVVSLAGSENFVGE